MGPLSRGYGNMYLLWTCWVHVHVHVTSVTVFRFERVRGRSVKMNLQANVSMIVAKTS